MALLSSASKGRGLFASLALKAHATAAPLLPTAFQSPGELQVSKWQHSYSAGAGSKGKTSLHMHWLLKDKASAPIVCSIVGRAEIFLHLRRVFVEYPVHAPAIIGRE